MPQWHLRQRRVRVAARRRTPSSSTLNNWQRGDYKPYVVKSTDRGKTWTNISRQPAGEARRVVDHPGSRERRPGVRGHRVRAVLHAWTADRTGSQLKGGMPPAQVRDMTVQRRENDFVLATFGRGFYILDDYSALRELSRRQALDDDARLFPLRDAVLVQPDRHGAGRHGGLGADVGELDAPRTRRSAPCSPINVQAGTAGGRQAGADDHRRCRAARSAGSSIDKSARAEARARGTCGSIRRLRPRAGSAEAAGSGGPWRARRTPVVLAAAEAASRGRWCSRAATGRRSADGGRHRHTHWRAAIVWRGADTAVRPTRARGPIVTPNCERGHSRLSVPGG